MKKGILLLASALLGASMICGTVLADENTNTAGAAEPAAEAEASSEHNFDLDGEYTIVKKWGTECGGTSGIIRFLCTAHSEDYQNVEAGKTIPGSEFKEYVVHVPSKHAFPTAEEYLKNPADYADFVVKEEAATCEKDGYVVLACMNTVVNGEVDENGVYRDEETGLFHAVVDCDETVTIAVPKHTHTWSDEADAFDDYKIVQKMDCTHNEVGKVYCVECGKLKEELVDASELEKNDSYTKKTPGHQWVATGKVISASTCHTMGTQEYQCSVCKIKQNKSDMPLDPNNHEFGEWQEEIPATCTEPGSNYRLCKWHTGDFDANAKEVRTTEPLGHKFQTVITKVATCDEAGKMYTVCTVCGEKTEEVEYENAKGHVWDEWKVTTPATCTEKGVETRVCKLNKEHTETREIEAKGHNWSEWVERNAAGESTPGYWFRQCLDCGEHEEWTGEDVADAAHKDDYKLDLSKVTKTDTTAGTGMITMGKKEYKALYVRVAWHYTLANGDTFSYCVIKDVVEDKDGNHTFKMAGPTAPYGATLNMVQVTLTDDAAADVKPSGFEVAASQVLR